MTHDIREMLVVSDMDGTLLTDDKRLLGCNLEAIRLFTMLGGNFTVATGRVCDSVARYTELTKYLAPAITCGGTVLYDLQKSKVVHSEILPRAVAKMAVKDVMRAFPSVGVVVFTPNTPPYLCASSPQSQILFDDEQISYLVRPFEELPQGWNKVIFAGPPDLLARIGQYVAEQTYPGVYFVPTAPIYFELMPEGVNKGTALQQLCDCMGLSIENTIAVGDFYNDLDMMHAAGRSVAMRNAPPDVAMQADEITGSNSDGGVGQLLYNLVQLLT